MIELPLVFVAGILGTAHCLGMCGPMVLAIGGTSPRWTSALGRQAAYTIGRVFSYGVLGATAGSCGDRLAHNSPTIVHVPAILAIAAGVLLIYQGLLATGFGKKGALNASPGACLAGGFLAQFLRRPHGSGIFLAGVFTGFLPCGLLYGMLALATATHSLLLGGATLVSFGLGTAPVMMLAGLGGRLLGLATRRRLHTAAACCLLITGVVSLARGVSFLSIGDQTAVTCPLCTE